MAEQPIKPISILDKVPPPDKPSQILTANDLGTLPGASQPMIPNKPSSSKLEWNGTIPEWHSKIPESDYKRYNQSGKMNEFNKALKAYKGGDRSARVLQILVNANKLSPTIKHEYTQEYTDRVIEEANQNPTGVGQSTGDLPPSDDMPPSPPPSPPPGPSDRHDQDGYSEGQASAPQAENQTPIESANVSGTIDDLQAPTTSSTGKVADLMKKLSYQKGLNDEQTKRLNPLMNAQSALSYLSGIQKNKDQEGGIKEIRKLQNAIERSNRKKEQDIKQAWNTELKKREDFYLAPIYQGIEARANIIAQQNGRKKPNKADLAQAESQILDAEDGRVRREVEQYKAKAKEETENSESLAKRILDIQNRPDPTNADFFDTTDVAFEDFLANPGEVLGSFWTAPYIGREQFNQTNALKNAEKDRLAKSYQTGLDTLSKMDENQQQIVGQGELAAQGQEFAKELQGLQQSFQEQQNELTRKQEAQKANMEKELRAATSDADRQAIIDQFNNTQAQDIEKFNKSVSAELVKQADRYAKEAGLSAEEMKNIQKMLSNPDTPLDEKMALMALFGIKSIGAKVNLGGGS